VPRKDDGDWVKRCTNFVVEGRLSKHVLKTCIEVVGGDLKTVLLRKDDACDCKK